MRLWHLFGSRDATHSSTTSDMDPPKVRRALAPWSSVPDKYGGCILCRLQYSYEVTPSVHVASCPTCEPMQVIQYINMIKTDSMAGYGIVYSSGGDFFYHISTADFQGDDVEGHGTHTAGSALGATLTNPAETTTCDGTTKVPGCVGGCVDVDRSSWGDDLLTMPAYSVFAADVDRICPVLECDDETEQWCLSDDVGETLAEHGGMAQGAKLAFFDIFADKLVIAHHVGNGLWEPCLEAGCKVHSNSWGDTDPLCRVKAIDIQYDDFMHKVSNSRSTPRPSISIPSIPMLIRWFSEPPRTKRNDIAS